jgi:pimeloyl-ACP methyl ester carboxylesterase
VREIASDVLERFVAKNAEPRWGLLGLSLGGMVALEVAQLAPLAFSHIVLVNSSSTLSPSSKRMKPRALLKLTVALSQSSALEREKHIYALNTYSPSARERAIPAATFFETAPMQASTVLRQLLAAARYAAPGQLQQRCLVVNARLDGMVAPSCSARLARHFLAERVEHPFAGHDLPCDDPGWLARRVSSWALDG